MSPFERASIKNAVWLCQICAKLIDSDSATYTVEVIRNWKAEAEAAALAGIESRFSTADAVAVTGRQHVNVPDIGGVLYADARALLIAAGWQPLKQSPRYSRDPNIALGNGPLFWQRGYWEITYSSGTGAAHCRFEFRDVYSNLLAVVTEGEAIPAKGVDARVCRWFFVDERQPETPTPADELVIDLEEEKVTFTEMLRSFAYDIVKVHAHTHSVGVMAEHNWIRNRYPKGELISQSLTTLDNLKGHSESGDSPIHFDVITVRLESGRKKNIYFDISSFFTGRGKLMDPSSDVAEKLNQLYRNK